MKNQLTYSEKLRHPNWQKKRLETLQRDHWACTACGDADTNLQIHHKEYNGYNRPEDTPGHDLTTLCEHCHWIVTYLLKRKIKVDDFEVVKINLNKLGIAYADKSIYIFNLYNKIMLVELNPINAMTVRFFINSWNKSESTL